MSEQISLILFHFIFAFHLYVTLREFSFFKEKEKKSVGKNEGSGEQQGRDDFSSVRIDNGNMSLEGKSQILSAGSADVRSWGPSFFRACRLRVRKYLIDSNLTKWRIPKEPGKTGCAMRTWTVSTSLQMDSTSKTALSTVGTIHILS